MFSFFEILPEKKIKKKFFPDALPAFAGSQRENYGVPVTWSFKPVLSSCFFLVQNEDLDGISNCLK